MPLCECGSYFRQNKRDWSSPGLLLCCHTNNARLCSTTFEDLKTIFEAWPAESPTMQPTLFAVSQHRLETIMAWSWGVNCAVSQELQQTCHLDLFLRSQSWGAPSDWQFASQKFLQSRSEVVLMVHSWRCILTLNWKAKKTISQRKSHQLSRMNFDVTPKSQVCFKGKMF